MFIVVNVILLPLFSKLNIQNYYIIGAILSLLYSSTARYLGSPQNLLKINPNTFQLKALVIWTLYYGLIIGNLVD